MSSKILTHPEQKPTVFHNMVTVSPQMEEVFETLEKAARDEARILIRGETGTGKELAAQALHEMSDRSDEPFEALNCATLTGEMLASELFGHVEGAFTGAIRDRVGLFERADGGTVFLDEIAELPLDLQARLLRVIQEESFVPLGAQDPVSVDIRLISATNQSLRNAIERGKFREDLMYRVRVVPIFLPRLTERDGDIEALTWHFIEEFNAKKHRRIDEIEVSTMELMKTHFWPGNIRELENVIEYAFVIGSGPVFTPDELTPEIRGEPPPEKPEKAPAEHQPERKKIIQVLRKADGKKQKAAELLGISRTTLWRKMREYGLQQ